MASQDNFVRTALRVPQELHKKLHEAAVASNRTFNAEIVDRLERSFSDVPDVYILGSKIDGIVEKVEEIDKLLRVRQ